MNTTKRPRSDFREMREMLRAMQAGELTVSRGIEILEIWEAGNWNDDMLPPVRQDLIEEDSMPVEIIDRLKQQLAEYQATNGKLREALREFLRNPAGDYTEDIAGEALALPSDATALNELIAERTASLTAAVERLNERQDFAPDQWWVKELESIETTLRPLTHDQYRAVRIAVTAVKVSMHDNEELRKQNAELTAQRDAAMKLLQEVFQEPDAIWAMGDGWKERLDAAIANGKEPGKCS